VSWSGETSWRGLRVPIPWSAADVAAPASFPVDRDLVRLNVRADPGPDELDPLFNLWLRAAVQFVETEARTLIAPRQVRFTFARFPTYYEGSTLYLPMGHVRGVVSLEYTDTTGTSASIDPLTGLAAWLDSNPPAVMPAGGYAPWPDTYAGSLVRVVVDAGWDNPDDVPASLTQAVLALTGFFAQRPDLVDKNGDVKVPSAVRSLASAGGYGGYGG
jgi:uncharacterized phiE125 gp8 family phage protein